jgi:hypothetical protein
MSNNSTSIIVRIFWFAYYCFSCVSEQESIKKKWGRLVDPDPKFLLYPQFLYFTQIIQEHSV